MIGNVACASATLAPAPATSVSTNSATATAVLLRAAAPIRCRMAAHATPPEPGRGTYWASAPATCPRRAGDRSMRAPAWRVWASVQLAEAWSLLLSGLQEGLE